ncbi:serine O-acetyltransferase [Arthrobacter sp. R4]|uniref:serine O-acetyltransferase n=1 Tax=Arthrobacter sp. R4 TaxID=644417 RepID=UPI003ED84874
MQKIEVELENFFQLKATAKLEARLCAFYLFLNDEVIERTPYTARATHTFPLDKAGVYRVKLYAKSDSGEIISEISERFRFAGFSDVARSPDKKNVAIVGVNRTSGFAAHIFAARNTVLCFVDPGLDYVGTEFFGRPVVGMDALPGDAIVVGHEAYEAEYGNLRSFTLSNGAVDILSKELHRFSVMDLYRLSRSAYLEGFKEGAHYIQTFIFNKFNSRVPYLATIGEGTRLGIGGIGTVIHPESVIGRDCVIAQNVTLGSRVRGNGTPIVGNNVFIAPGAKCFGGKIGNNVVIGANAVVLDEIPDNCVVAGVPARIISRDISRYTDYTARPSRQ